MKANKNRQIGVNSYYRNVHRALENKDEVKVKSKKVVALIPLYQTLKVMHNNEKTNQEQSKWYNSIKKMGLKYTNAPQLEHGIRQAARAPLRKARKSAVVSRFMLASLATADDAKQHTTAKKIQMCNKKMERKRQCAAAIESIASNVAMHESLLLDGAVPILLALCRTSDVGTNISCTGSMCYLAMDPTGSARELLIRSGCVKALLGIVQSYSDDRIVHNCVATLANLTIENGFESTIVKEKILDVFLDQYDVSDTFGYMCTMALFNLTCPQYSYPRIEDVIQAINTIAKYCDDKHHEIISRSLLNLCSHRNNQKIIHEHETLSVFNSLALSKMESVRNNNIKALYQISELSTNHKHLTKAGCVEVLVSALIRASNEAEINKILQTIYNLAPSATSCERMGQAGIFDVFHKLRTSIQDISNLRLIFSITSFLVVHVNNWAYLSENFIEMLLIETDTVNFERNILFSLAMLTSSASMPESKQTVDFDQIQDTTSKVNNIFSNPSHLEKLLHHACAPGFPIDSSEEYLQSLILHNCCFLHDVALLHSQGFSRIRHIAENNLRQDIKLAACETLVMFTRSTNLHRILIKGGLLDILEMLLLTKMDDLVSLCLEAISILFDGKILYDYEGVVDKFFPLLVKLCIRGNKDVRTRSAACFARFSTISACRTFMVNNGLIGSLALLAGDDDPNTLMLCVNTYSHLTCDSGICTDLIENGIVKSLTSLSAAPEECVRRACAVAFCNLSFREENITSLVQKGTLPALLVISCVKSNDNETRRLCMKAVINLMRKESNFPQMCKEGLAWAFTVFAENISTDDAYLVALAFCGLAYCPLSRSGVCRPSILNPFVLMLQPTSSQTDENTQSFEIKKTILHGILNLLDNSNRVHATQILLDLNTLDILHEMIQHADKAGQVEDAVFLHIAQVLGIMHASCMPAQKNIIEKSSMHSDLAILLSHPSTSDETKYNCALAVHCMSLDALEAKALISHGALLRSVFVVINAESSEKLVTLVMRILYNVSCIFDHLKVVCDMGALQSVDFIVKTRFNDLESIKMCAAILRNLSAQDKCHNTMVSSGAVVLLKKIFQSKDRICKEDSAISISNLILGNVNSNKALIDGALPAVLWLAMHSNPTYLRICSAALRKLATPTGNIDFLIQHDAIPIVVALLEATSSYFVKHNCIATMCLLSNKLDARPILSSYGAISLVAAFIRNVPDINAGGMNGQMYCDLLSNMAPFIRPEVKEEQSVSSILIQLAQVGDSNLEIKNWKADRTYLKRDESDDCLPMLLVSDERKLSGEAIPRVAPGSYPVKYDGYNAGFNLCTNAVEQHNLERIAPTIAVVGEKTNSLTSNAFFKNATTASKKSSRWKKLATVEFATTKMFPKITKANFPYISESQKAAISTLKNCKEVAAMKEFD